MSMSKPWLTLALLAGCAVMHAQTTPAESPSPTYTVPAGTKVLLSLKSGINTKTAQKGDGVYLVSTFPVVGNGGVLIPVGVYVQGVVDRVQRAGRIKGRAQLDVHFTTMIFPSGQVVAVPGVLDSLPGSDGPKVKGNEGTVEQASNKGKDIGDIAKGAAIGAETGAIAGAASGHLGEGLGIGGAAGAAAGAIYTLLTRGNDIVIPAGSAVEMVLQRPLTLLASHSTGTEASELVPANQQKPMEKHGPKITCPYGSLGCP
jgi:type IV secretion system protein VirB10